MSVKDAMEKYSARLLRAPRTKKNKKPERDLVQIPCVEWMRQRGWSVNIYESKAIFSPTAGRYIGQSMLPGTCDCMGVDQAGHGVFLEFKAPGRLKTIKHHQRKFLLEKIDSGAFGAVVDSVVRLGEIYETWIKLRLEDKFDEAKEYLKNKIIYK